MFSAVFPPQNTDFDKLPWVRVPLWKSGGLLEMFQHTAEEKKSDIGCTEEGKRNSFILPTSPFSQDSTAQSQERSSWPTLLPRGKVRACV